MSSRRPHCTTLSFPGEDARESWSCGVDAVWKRAAGASGGMAGIEMACFDSAPFWYLGHAEAPEDAVALRWEGLGLRGEEGALPWTHWTVAQKGKQSLVATLGLTEPFATEREMLGAETFEPSARLLPLPDNSLVIWKELGRHVAAFTCGARLLHTSLLTSRVLDADAAFELRDLAFALQAHGFIVTPAAVHVWTRCDPAFAPQIACLFEEAAVIKEPRPDPRPPASPCGILPAQVAVLRQQKKLRQGRLLMLAAAAMIYCGFFAAWWLRLQWRESRLNHTEQELAAAQPEVDSVRQAQEHWLAMEGALNPDLYPVELFHQVVSLLPEEGIRLKEFQLEDRRLIVSGEATTVNHALGFKDRLAACEPLQRYTWNFPVPAIREDNRAEFRAEGILEGGTVHEGQ